MAEELEVGVEFENVLCALRFEVKYLTFFCIRLRICLLAILSTHFTINKLV